MTEKVPGTPVHEYQDALACLECIWHLVGSGADVSRLDPLLMSSFYERLSTVLVRLHASEQRPGLKESLRALLEEAQHQQLKAERICRRPAPRRRAGSSSARQGSTSPAAPDRGRPPAPVSAAASTTAARPAAVSDDAVRVGDSASVATFPFTRSELRFSDVAGLEQTKASLAEAVIMPVQFPHLFTGGRRPWTRILLYGPPGTGKSRLAAAVAGEAGATLFPVSAADLLSSYVGETEKAMSELFAAAARTPGRSVIFVDELDGLCRERSGREEEHTRRLKTHLLQLMDGLLAGPAQAAATFLLAATNCPWDLDPAFLRRFQRRLHVPLPDRAAQRRLVELHLAGTAAPLTEREWQQLLAGTAGLSGSDLAQLTQHALYQPLRELETARCWRRTADGKFMVCDPSEPGAFTCSVADIPFHAVAARDLRLSDFLGALRTTAPSVSAEMLHRYDEFGRGRAGPP